MKLIVTSATMDAKKFADFFGNVPTFQVSVVLLYRCFVIACLPKPKITHLSIPVFGITFIFVKTETELLLFSILLKVINTH